MARHQKSLKLKANHDLAPTQLDYVPRETRTAAGGEKTKERQEEKSVRPLAQVLTQE